MTLPLFRLPDCEPSAATAFAGNRLDRQSENRSESSISDALRHPEAKVLILHQGRALINMDRQTENPFFSIDNARTFGIDEAELVLLGFASNVPFWAAPLTGTPEALPETIKLIDYRSLYKQGLLPAEHLGVLAQGAALVNWNQTHKFCARCGSPSQPRDGGYRRNCSNCGADHFPRTDPVVIMLVVDEDKCLLGRSPHFDPGVYSCLAGFVEPGETLENAVRREVFEESGIRVGRVGYYASQPWPFVHTLMIGCHAMAQTSKITLDNELEDCRWFTREQVRTMMQTQEGEGPRVAPSGAIAFHLIKAWVESN